MIALIDKHADINLRQTALNLLKLEIDVEAFGIKYRQRGMTHKKQVKGRQSQLKDFDEIVKEENSTLRDEYKKISNIKDANAKIWKTNSNTTLTRQYWLG